MTKAGSLLEMMERLAAAKTPAELAAIFTSDFEIEPPCDFCKKPADRGEDGKPLYHETLVPDTAAPTGYLPLIAFYCPDHADLERLQPLRDIYGFEWYIENSQVKVKPSL